MAFDAFDLLAGVDAAAAGLIGSFDGLAVHDGGAGLGIGLGLLAHRLAQDGVDLLPQPGLRPAPEAAIAGGPGAELGRQ